MTTPKLTIVIPSLSLRLPAMPGLICLVVATGLFLTQTAQCQEAKFETLFNGKDLSGWKHNGNWEVVDGVISRKGKGGPLRYQEAKVPDDFELRFEWKVAKGSNSGVYYRPGQYEYQILDNDVHRDGKNPRTSAASLYFCMAPSEDATLPVGQWNKGRIICKGTVIQHWLNGKKVIDFDYTDPRWAADVERLKKRGADVKDRGGDLWLQDHGDPVWYRNIRWRAIPETEQLQRSEVTPAKISQAVLKQEASKLQGIVKRRQASQNKPAKSAKSASKKNVPMSS